MTQPADADRSATPRPLRVWLEPGYDGGRIGAWMLDVPGLFAWALDPDRALTNALSAAGRFREWLEDLGEPFELPSLRWAEVVDEVAAVPGPEGEAKARFAHDRRPVGDEELERAIRRLEHARTDLLGLAARVAAHEALHGPLAVEDGARPGRAAEAVLRHVAGAEVMLASRLAPEVRYPGPADGPLEVHLAETRAWALGRLRALHAAVDPLAEVVDRRGEAWTLAKVVRRLVYHSLDHLWELDRRLARADGTGPATDVRLDRRPSLDAAVRLLRSVGWDVRTEDPAALASGIAGAREVATAWHDGRLVGMARSIGDGAMNAYIATVVVHPRWQGLGVGERIMRALMDGHDGVRFRLSAASGVDAWYAAMGFEPDHRAMVRRRAT